tara:strand:- start:110 stop:430 length:321 start_codon:yes stop_codon:yes gene_type:complete
MAALGVLCVHAIVVDNLIRKRVWISRFNLVSRLSNNLEITLRVTAALARAIAAKHPGRKAIAVQLQALRLFTVALLGRAVEVDAFVEFTLVQFVRKGQFCVRPGSL